MNKKVLIIAFHFPPMGGSSAGLRSLKFVKYLPKHGWQPTVLTANPRVYDRLDESGLKEIPKDTEIIRAFGLDAKKHLSIRSRYPQLVATPDRWITWSIGAIPAGLRAIRKHNIDVIFTTFPIATTVLIGLALRRLTGLPWIADFRDPMIEDGYPPELWTKRVHKWIETSAVRHASRLVFTTESTRIDHKRRHPSIPDDNLTVISNGYDEVDFVDLKPEMPRDPDATIRLVHGGIIYPEDRDPRPLFRAIRTMLADSVIRKGDLKIELRGSRLNASFKSITKDLGIDDIVHFLPGIPYDKFLSDASAADGLIVFQGKSCDRQIPAKTYEYLRIGKPIFALTSPTGETADLLRRSGGATTANLVDENDIAKKLSSYLNKIRQGAHPRPNELLVKRYSRSNQASLLAECLDSLARN